MPTDLLPRLRRHEPELIAIRHDLHRHPELGFEERRTATLVATKLRGWGIEVAEGIARTGVVGTLRGRRGAGGAIALRADMDALPILEATGAAHASVTPGVMHACGHGGDRVPALHGGMLGPASLALIAPALRQRM